jgi:hypothetical protein
MVSAKPSLDKVSDDDLNHLLLSCRLSGEMSAGLRYAYSRLDTIDKKSSEIFRSYTILFGFLVSAHVIGGRPHILANGPISLGIFLSFLVFVALAAIAIDMAWQHRNISSLNFYRIGISACDASALQSTMPLKLDSPEVKQAFASYLTEISAVTVDREDRLRRMGGAYYVGMILLLIEAFLLVIF